jgi:regulatory protein
MRGHARRPDPTPLDIAARLLARAPLSEAAVEARLVAKGYQPATAAATVARCRELGWLSDETFAHDRARALRARGAGCLKVTADLEHHGVPSRLVAAAVEASLDGMSEADLARTVVRQAGCATDPPRAWRLLAARGFPEDVMADVVDPPD